MEPQPLTGKAVESCFGDKGESCFFKEDIGEQVEMPGNTHPSKPANKRFMSGADVQRKRMSTLKNRNRALPNKGPN